MINMSKDFAGYKQAKFTTSTGDFF